VASGSFLSNAQLSIRFWQTQGSMDHLVRNGDGDELVFVHAGGGELFCDYGHLTFRDGDYLMSPRGTLWRIESSEPATMLLVEATNGSFRLPDRGIAGQQAIFDAAILDTPRIDDAFRAHFTHGPHPKAFAAGAKHARKETDEVAVMIDPRDALDVAPLPEGVESLRYVDSWKG
jgi:homogentisate 1,2-dioxygenase